MQQGTLPRLNSVWSLTPMGMAMHPYSDLCVCNNISLRWNCYEIKGGCTFQCNINMTFDLVDLVNITTKKAHYALLCLSFFCDDRQWWLMTVMFNLSNVIMKWFHPCKRKGLLSSTTTCWPTVIKCLVRCRVVIQLIDIYRLYYTWSVIRWFHYCVLSILPGSLSLVLDWRQWIPSYQAPR